MGIVISTHLPPPVMIDSTEVLKWATHMLCWTWAMYFSAAASSENAQGKHATIEIGANRFLNQRCALALDLESTLRAQMRKVVLQHYSALIRQNIRHHAPRRG